MRKFANLFIAALLGVAFVLASTSASAAPEFYGDFRAGFGQVSYAEDDGNPASDDFSGSEWYQNFEQNMYYRGGDDELKYNARIRYRGVSTHLDDVGGGGLISGTDQTGYSSNQPTHARFWMTWMPTKGFSIMLGWLNGIGGLAGYSEIDKAQQPYFSQVYRGYLSQEPGIVFEYKTGAIRVGLGLAASCDEGCGADEDPTYGEQTLLPFVAYKTKTLQANVRLTMESGKIDKANSVSGKDETTSGSGTGAGVEAKLGFGTIGFDYWSGKSAAVAATNEDATRDTIGIAAKLKMGLDIMYTTDTNTNVDGVKDDKVEDVHIQVQYFMKAGAGVVGPVYGTVTRTYSAAAPAKDATQDMSYLSLVYNMKL